LGPFRVVSVPRAESPPPPPPPRGARGRLRRPEKNFWAWGVHWAGLRPVGRGRSGRRDLTARVGAKGEREVRYGPAEASCSTGPEEARADGRWLRRGGAGPRRQPVGRSVGKGPRRPG